LVVQKISVLVKEKLGAVGINILQNNNRIAGQGVDHIHFHVIPRYIDGSLKISHSTEYKGDDIEEVIELLVKTRTFRTHNYALFVGNLIDLYGLVLSV
jgi:histidine triad (HIT) family protein